MINICLLWHSSSSDNLGVGALTMSQIYIIDNIAAKLDIPVRYHIAGTFGDKSYLKEDCRIAGVTLLTLKRLLTGQCKLSAVIKECDFVLDIGEGDSFTDIYGHKRFFQQILSKMIVLLNKRRLILCPQTIGPFNSSFTRFLSGIVMKRAERVYARDGLSIEYLQNNGMKGNVEEAIDIAFQLPYLKEEKLTKQGKVKLGLNISGLLYNGGCSGSNIFNLSVNYADLTHKLLTELSQLKDTQIYLISHVISDANPFEDDFSICNILHSQFPNSILVDKFATPSEAKSFISTMDFFIGARMHACIAAFSSGVPVVPFSYSRKFIGLFTSLGYIYVGDCKKDSTDELLNLALSSFYNREKLKQDVEHGNSIALNKLSHYEKYIEQLLLKTHAKKTVNK